MGLSTEEIEQALIPLVEACEQLGITYYVGGSVASSAHGILRQTEDVDVVVDLQFQHVRPLVRLLEAVYYIDADTIREAIHHRSSFNVIYQETVVKIDVFIPKQRQFSLQERLRARVGVLAKGTRPFYVSSPEDIILNKLEWYKMGNEISIRQWKDILGTLNTKAAELDLDYLEQWAANLKVSDLLQRALGEAGLKTE